jgi:dihydroorotate dehydrogenase
LVQIYTGWIYEGPILVPESLEGRVQQLERHGLATLAEAVGSGLPWRPAP